MEQKINEKELAKRREYIESLKCSRCGSMQTYSLADGTLICRKCSYRENKSKK